MQLKQNYPIVLIHGTAAKDNTLFWGRIPSALRQQGFTVYYGKTDAWGSIAHNAQMLRNNLLKIAAETPVEKFHLIGHSKGAIDARYMISSLATSDIVASLTSVSTPHQGTPLADYIMENRFLNHPIARILLQGYAQCFGDSQPVPMDLIRSLSTQEMTAFNTQNPDHPRIFYQSYSSTMWRPQDDLFYLPTYTFLKNKVGDNDGIVPLASARWGEQFTPIVGATRGLSHAEVTDMKRRKIAGIKIPNIYLDMIRSLQERNF
ncbi:hypothetical protein PQ465_07445 [Sphingobacterium oryzagri]|uniref:AB hydrolase-1 domain-containing protein n=1 Tax=Sphingobacterium oryzagri TaxID=3025669 RepID=A0ABY7WKT6_9SPHI|nr:alpha/beta fold hydrolase [Sphingobacterium sp. KACC 22765]WDF70203.1 hypothetical protein PQ465_07445 [Sphingobacterium sp. KACC 22765]